MFSTVPSSGTETAEIAATAAATCSRVVLRKRVTNSTPSAAGAIAAASVTGSSGGVSTSTVSYQLPTSASSAADVHRPQ